MTACVAWRGCARCSPSCQSQGAEDLRAATAKSGTVWVKKAKYVGGLPVLGKQVAQGDGIDLRVTPDGKFATYLLDAQKPRLDGIPPVMRLGALYAVSTAGGEPRKLGAGVTNMPGGYLFQRFEVAAVLGGVGQPVGAVGRAARRWT